MELAADDEAAAEHNTLGNRKAETLSPPGAVRLCFQVTAKIQK